MNTYYYQAECMEKCQSTPDNVFESEGIYIPNSYLQKDFISNLKIRAANKIKGIQIDRVKITMLVKL